jgi:hypothetical protein
VGKMNRVLFLLHIFSVNTGKLTCEKWKGKKGIKQELPARNIRQV